MKERIPTIGLEIHAELKTATKMFCSSANNPDATEPNVHICPICMGHPGTLPTINKAAVRHVLRVGLAVEGELADYTEFDRKNYFYPDIPKGYQISQYEHPLVKGGILKGVAIHRIHLEEDTARSQHADGTGESLVDFNRAGVPLMELVTEPVIHTAKEASAFARELRLLLRTLGVSDADMEKGQMRVEANVSVGEGAVLGTKVEVKNLNSFRSAERAIEYEVARQNELLDRGERVVQETRGWDEVGQKTFSQRQKEESHDYRYFPDPDLPSLRISEVPEFATDALRASLSELPQERRIRYQRDYQMRADEIEFFLTNEPMAQLLEAVAELARNKDMVRLGVNYIVSDLAALTRGEGTQLLFNAEQFVRLMQMLQENKISSRGAKDILAVMHKEGGEPEKIAEYHNLWQESDTALLEKVAVTVIDKNPGPVAEYRSGKEAALQYLVGQGMKATRGSANPGALLEIFKRTLE